MKLQELILTGLCMLKGEWKVDYVFYVMDADYWKWRLYTRRN